MQVIYKLKSILIHQEPNGFCIMPMEYFFSLGSHLPIYHLADLNTLPGSCFSVDLRLTSIVIKLF